MSDTFLFRDRGRRVSGDRSRPRRYERGENRRKHIGTGREPEIVRQQNGELLGKCPAGFSENHRQQLLDEAVPVITTPPSSKAFPKRLYAVDSDGTIYAAETTNRGDSYHGHPYAGRMGQRLLGALREQARVKKCESGFENWVKRYIKIGGPPDL
jgi:hypothetical protein